MKKIISLLSVFAIICTMFTTVAFAGSDEIYWEESVDGTNVTLTLKIESSKPVTTAKLYFDMTAAKAACDSITATKIDGATFSYNASKNVLAMTYTNVDGADSITMGEVTFTNVKSAFTLPRHTTKWVVTDASKEDFLVGMTDKAAGYEVKVAAAGPVVAELEKGGEMYGMNTQVAKVTTNGAEVSKAKVTLGKEFKYYDLPAGVSGTADFIAIIRYSAELGDNPAFELSVE